MESRSSLMDEMRAAPRAVLIKWLQENEYNLSRIKLENANLAEIQLQNAVLNAAKLRGVNFKNANLKNAFLVEADLSYADLSGANLSNAALTKTKLYRANLSGAELPGDKHFNLSGEQLITANLLGTKLQIDALTLSELKREAMAYSIRKIRQSVNVDEVLQFCFDVATTSNILCLINTESPFTNFYDPLDTYQIKIIVHEAKLRILKPDNRINSLTIDEKSIHALQLLDRIKIRRSLFDKTDVEFSSRVANERAWLLAEYEEKKEPLLARR